MPPSTPMFLIEVRVDGLRLDFFGHLDRRRVRVHHLNRLHFGRLWRRGRRRWGRGRRRSCHKRHHRWRRRQNVGCHQRDDDHRRDDGRFNENRHPNRFALVVPELYRRVDDIAEHSFITWHRSSPSLETPRSRAERPIIARPKKQCQRNQRSPMVGPAET